MTDARSPLRSARDHLGLSREKVGAELSISSKTVERHENGAPVKRWLLERYAELYRVPVEQLESHLPKEAVA